MKHKKKLKEKVQFKFCFKNIKFTETNLFLRYDEQLLQIFLNFLLNTNFHIYLFVQELPRVFFDVSFIQVGGQAHQAHFGQAKVSQLDVSNRGDQEAENRIKAIRALLQNGDVTSEEPNRLTCRASGLGVRCRSCAGTPVRGRSLRSTCAPFPRAERRCFSAEWHSPLLSAKNTDSLLIWTI